jgi:hypothetical protein
VLDELGFVPVVNKYVADQEFQLKRYMTELVNNGYIKVVGYPRIILGDFYILFHLNRLKIFRLNQNSGLGERFCAII